MERSKEFDTVRVKLSMEPLRSGMSRAAVGMFDTVFNGGEASDRYMSSIRSRYNFSKTYDSRMQGS